MALQVNLGTVEVTKNQPTVLHQWRLLMATGAPGTFAVGQIVTWPGSGTGTVGAWDSVSKILLTTRTAGANPAAGTVITGPSGSATVSSVATGSPPNWQAKVTLPAVATFERHYASYEVASVAYDSFVLASNYLGESFPNVEYGLNTDFTSLGLGIIRAGDVGATAIISRSMVRLNNLLTRGAAALRLGTAATMTNGGTISWGVTEEDTGGFIVGLTPWTIFTVPAGIARVDIGCNVKLVSALSTGAQEVEIRLLKNTNEIAVQSMAAPRIALQAIRGSVPVVAGDTFSVKTYIAGSGLPQIEASTLTNFSIRVAEVI